MGVVFPVSEPYAHTAERALSVGDAHTASAATLRELSVSPLAEDAWVRLARIDESEHAHLTTRGDEALQHAYDALPYDAGPGTQRSNFVLTHFDELSPALREQVGEELHVWARSGALESEVQSFEGPAVGRLCFKCDQRRVQSVRAMSKPTQQGLGGFAGRRTAVRPLSGSDFCCLGLALTAVPVALVTSWVAVLWIYVGIIVLTVVARFAEPGPRTKGVIPQGGDGRGMVFFRRL